MSTIDTAVLKNATTFKGKKVLKEPIIKIADEVGNKEELIVKDYNKLTVKVLKEILEQRKLSKIGLKSILVARLEEDDQKTGKMDAKKITKKGVKKPAVTKKIVIGVKEKVVPKKSAIVNDLEDPSDSKPFDTLPISTQTVMAYANCTFNTANISEKLSAEPTDAKDIKKIVGEHGKIYRVKSGGAGVKGVPTKKGHFRNQVGVCIYVIDKMLTIKIFPTGKLHLTGVKNLNHQKEAVKALMVHIISLNTEEQPTYQVDDDSEPLNVILEVVMVNVDFHLGFDVDQKKLDKLLQNENTDFYTIYETPANTSVNIKLDYDDPEEKIYQQIIFNDPTDHSNVEYTTTNSCPKAKLKNTRTHTFLVFSSSKVIQSGRFYDSEMEPAYEKFNNFILENRKDIELCLREQTFDITQLKGLRGNFPLQLKPIKNDKIHLGK